MTTFIGEKYLEIKETDSERVKNLKEDRQHTLAKREELYFTYRYRKGSYKARKCGLQPILMMAKRGGDKIRVYGEADEVISPIKIAFATARFRAWGQKERELKRLAKKTSGLGTKVRGRNEN